MNKTEAKKLAVSNDKPVSYYLALVEEKKKTAFGKASKVNKSLPLDQVLGIYEQMLKQYPQDKVLEGARYDVRKRVYVPSSMSMGLANILRDCA